MVLLPFLVKGITTLPLSLDGTVCAWGSNFYAQLGDGTEEDRNTPVQVSNLGGVIAIATGNSHSLALKSDGTVWSWGLNGFGQLGDDSPRDRHTPVQVKNVNLIQSVAQTPTMISTQKADSLQ